MPVTLIGNVVNLAIYISNDGSMTNWKAAPGFVANTGRGELVDFVSPTDALLGLPGVLHQLMTAQKPGARSPPSVAFGELNMASLDFVSTSTGWVLTMDTAGHNSFYKTTDGGKTRTTLIP